MTEIINPIPARLKNVAQGGHVAGAEDIDAGGNKNQKQVNDDVNLGIQIINDKIGTMSGNKTINKRLDDLEAAESITYEGGEAQIAQGSDFTNPDATKRAKIPTVGAIVDGLNDGVYDVSKRNPTAGPNSDGKFTLEYILNNANTLIPTGWRHGGMTISFVSSSDNKYVHFRYMGTATTGSPNPFLNIDNWQGVDNEPIAGSKNLVESGGVSNNLLYQTINGTIDMSAIIFANVGRQSESIYTPNSARISGVIAHNVNGTTMQIIVNSGYKAAIHQWKDFISGAITTYTNYVGFISDTGWQTDTFNVAINKDCHSVVLSIAKTSDGDIDFADKAQVQCTATKRKTLKSKIEEIDYGFKNFIEPIDINWTPNTRFNESSSSEPVSDSSSDSSPFIDISDYNEIHLKGLIWRSSIEAYNTVIYLYDENRVPVKEFDGRDIVADAGSFGLIDKTVDVKGISYISLSTPNANNTNVPASLEEYRTMQMGVVRHEPVTNCIQDETSGKTQSEVNIDVNDKFDKNDQFLNPAYIVTETSKGWWVQGGLDINYEWVPNSVRCLLYPFVAINAGSKISIKGNGQLVNAYLKDSLGNIFVKYEGWNSNLTIQAKENCSLICIAKKADESDFVPNEVSVTITVYNREITSIEEYGNKNIKHNFNEILSEESLHYSSIAEQNRSSILKGNINIGISISEEDDKITHDATLQYNANTGKVYVVTMANKHDAGDSGEFSDYSILRLEIYSTDSGGNIGNKLDSIVVAKGGDTVGESTILGGCGVPNAYMVGNTLHILTSCKLADGVWRELHYSYNCSTDVLSAADVCMLGEDELTGHALSAAGAPILNWFNNQISINASIAKININNTLYYYACILSANRIAKGLIVRTTDFVNWEYVTTPRVNASSYYEGAMGSIDGYLYLALRQYGSNVQPLIVLKMDTECNIIEQIEIASCSSRPQFFELNGELYLMVARNNRQYGLIVRINSNSLSYWSKVVIAYNGNNYCGQYLQFTPAGNIQYFVHTPRIDDRYDVHIGKTSVFSISDDDCVIASLN